MRQNREATRWWGRTLALTWVLAIPVAGAAVVEGYTGQDARPPAALLEEAAATKDPVLRRRLAREALRGLAGLQPPRPWLEAQAWGLFGQPQRGLELVSGIPEAKRTDPDRFRAVRVLAEAFLAQSEPKAAQAVLSLVLPGALPPEEDRAGVLALRGRLLFVSGEFEQALPFLLRALRAGGRDRELLEALFQVLRRFDRQGRIEQAAEGFQALVEALPGETWTHLSLAVALRRAGRYEESDRALAAGAQRHTDDPEFPGERGLVEKARSRPGTAEKHMRQAIALEHRGGPLGSARANLGLLLLDQGRSDEALEVLQPLLSRPDPSTLPVLLWLRTRLRPDRPAL